VITVKVATLVTNAENTRNVTASVLDRRGITIRANYTNVGPKANTSSPISDLARSRVMCQIAPSCLNQVYQPSVSSSQIHLAIAFSMRPTSVGLRVKPGMR
jgi:hypothetical protein